jgi:hypothetical protein
MPAQGHARHGQDHVCASFPDRRLKRGELGLCVTLSETTDELKAVVQPHSWTLDGIDVFERVDGNGLGPDAEQSILYPSEVEPGEAIRSLTGRADRQGPTRVVFDSLSEMRLLAQDPLRYRRQVLALKQLFRSKCIGSGLADTPTCGRVVGAALVLRCAQARSSTRTFGLPRPHRMWSYPCWGRPVSTERVRSRHCIQTALSVWRMFCPGAIL